MTSCSAPALLVGAFERDNFGDLLFYDVSRRFFDRATVAAAPFPQDMTAVMGCDVESYTSWLEGHDVSAVMTVGGEVGATGMDYAYGTRLGAEARDAYLAADEERQRAMVAEAGGRWVLSPYMPRVGDFPRNSDVPTIINSVGLAGITRLSPPHREVLVGLLREADFVGVRDNESSALLTEHGIEHVLAPDVVHTIASHTPKERVDEGYALLQVSEPVLEASGVDEFARAIVTSAALQPLPLRLFFAGTAPGHDSAEKYDELIQRVLTLDPGRDISVLEPGTAWDRVDQVARAHIWIGSSLHGRIVASAYGVPRVSLQKPKVDVYAETWDPAQPWGVTPDGLDEAVVRALDAGEEAIVGTGRALAELAEESVRRAAAAASAERDPERAARRHAIARETLDRVPAAAEAAHRESERRRRETNKKARALRRAEQKAAEQELALHDVRTELADRESEIATLTAELELSQEKARRAVLRATDAEAGLARRQATLEAIYDSQSWRAARAIARISAPLRPRR